MRLKPDGSHLMDDHLNLGESPICCGTGQDEILLGHIDGSITEISTHGKPKGLPSITKETIECMVKGPLGLLIGTSNGNAICYRDGGVTWTIDLGTEIEHICYSNLERAWFSTWSGSNAVISHLEAENGAIIAHLRLSARLRDIAVHEKFTVIGMDDGRLLVFEEKMLDR